MKTAIIFYSFSGNTKTACEFLKEKLETKHGSIGMAELKPKEEEKVFFKQCLQAGFRKKPQIQAVDFNIQDYNFIIFASPVWAFTITPALRTYLENIGDLEGKKAACFLTYGSSAGKGKALNELENILRQKKAHILFSRNIKGNQVNNKSYLEKEFMSLLEIMTI